MGRGAVKKKSARGPHREAGSRYLTGPSRYRSAFCLHRSTLGPYRSTLSRYRSPESRHGSALCPYGSPACPYRAGLDAYRTTFRRSVTTPGGPVSIRSRQLEASNHQLEPFGLQLGRTDLTDEQACRSIRSGWRSLQRLLLTVRTKGRSLEHRSLTGRLADLIDPHRWSADQRPGPTVSARAR